MITLIAVAVQQGCRFGVGACDDDPSDLHDVQLETGGVQTFDLLVNRDQDFAALVPAFFGAGLLVFDVVAGNTGFDESLDKIFDVDLTAVPGIGISNDEWTVVDDRCGLSLLIGHSRTGVMLIPVGRQQGADQHGPFVWNLAQGITGQIRAGSSEVDPLADVAHPPR